MELGNKILELRKKQNITQEELAEKIGVTRQTISKWELGETHPDISQAKKLSMIFNISLDELVNNDTENIIIEKISNTEKLSGLVLKILKVIGVLFIIFLIIDVISLIVFIALKDVETLKVEEIEMNCSINNNAYVINIGSDGYFNCSNCSKELQEELKDKYIDFSNINKTREDINLYFENNNGIC